MLRSKPRIAASALSFRSAVCLCTRSPLCEVYGRCRLLANSEQEDTEDEIDEIVAKYKESMKGWIDLSVDKAQLM